MNICIAPDPSALTHIDDIGSVATPTTTGLGLLDRPFIPHINSPSHPETAACNEVSAALRARAQAHWALRDGAVLVVDGDLTQVLRAERGVTSCRRARSVPGRHGRRGVALSMAIRYYIRVK